MCNSPETVVTFPGNIVVGEELVSPLFCREFVLVPSSSISWPVVSYRHWTFGIKPIIILVCISILRPFLRAAAIGLDHPLLAVDDVADAFRADG